jgi:hypothetical protein
MQLALAVVSLVLFAALAVAFTVILVRAGRVVADTRVADAFRRDGTALADRAIAHVGDAASHIDRVRRRIDPPAALDDILPGTLEALAGLVAEAAALEPPPELEVLRSTMASELERAIRAAEHVRHGGALMGTTNGRPREVEGETSIKRGYLNLLHAREALQEVAADLRAPQAEARRWFVDRHSGT